MTATAFETPPAAPTLSGIVARCRTANDEALFERVRAAYAPVTSLSLEDEDLKMFLTVLYTSVRYWQPRIVVQTGTFVGTSTFVLALGMADNDRGELYTIDPEPSEYFRVREPVGIARHVIDASGLAERVRFVKGYSTVPLDSARMKLPVAPPWCLTRLPCHGRYDMLVVDGDHTFEGCLLDLEHGTEGLARDGARVVVVHDYLGIPDVRRAVRTWCETQGGCERRIVPSPCGVALLRVRPEQETTIGKEVDRWSQHRRQ